MHRKYIGFRLVCRTRPHLRVADAACRQGIRRGFSLVEMLVVMSIIVVLMGASNVLFRMPMSSAGEPAARMVRCIEMARAKAVASNRNVAIRFDAQAAGSRELVLRFLWARPGQTASTLKELEFRRAERFSNIVISKDVVIPDGKETSGSAGGALSARHLAPGESLVITPDGQVLLGTGSSGFPVPADQLDPVINLGVQPTIAGRVVDSVRRDVAIVQIQCASGTARVIQP
jgi:prepilin-type N-terminal cleavage/methylation domain-containing protein